ncbi:MAG: hypothetical protein WDZ47_08820 [Bacteroidales bacterium]
MSPSSIIFIFIVAFSSGRLQFGQQAVVTTGTDGTGDGGTVSYSLGQVVYQTHNGTNGSLAEGMQQSLIPVTPGPDMSCNYRNVLRNYANKELGFSVCSLVDCSI